MWVWIGQFLTRFLSFNIEFFAGLGRYKTGILFTKSNRYWIRYFARSCWCYHLQSKQSILVATVVILALLRKTFLTARGNKCIARECNKSGIYVYTYAPRKWQNHDILCQPEMTLFATTNANLPVLFLAASPDSLLLVKEFLFQACQVPSANFSFALRNTHINMWIT